MMAAAPEVSILVVTYNQQDTIGRALDSLLAQRCDFPYEIIIGEDGSTDATRAICSDYAARFPEHICLMPQAPNKGVVDNYFDCFEAARGRYVADCAGDDYWPDAGRLRLQRDYLERHPADVAVMSDWSIRPAGSRSEADARLSSSLPEYAPFTRPLAGPQMFRAALGGVGNFPLLSAMMFRREALLEVYAASRAKVRRAAWRCEDVPVVAALASRGSFGYLPLTASVYEVSAGSVSNAHRDCGLLFDFYCRAAGCVVDLCEFYGVEPADLRRGLDARVAYLASLALFSHSHGRRDAVRELARRLPWKQPLKTRLALASMSNEASWRLVAALKKTIRTGSKNRR